MEAAAALVIASVADLAVYRVWESRARLSGAAVGEAQAA